MKRVLLLIFVVLPLLGPRCYSQKNRNTVKVKPDTVAVDSIEYKLIVLDPGFEAWLTTKPPANFYSKEYYETRNRLCVLEWNYRYERPLRYGNRYETRIDYDANTDYGLELNYRLYYYFRFFEETNHTRLINYSP